MVKNLSVLFYTRNDKADSNNNVPIYCRITVNGKRSELSIHQIVCRDKWVPGSECVKGTNELSRSINAFIDNVRAKIYEHYHKLESESKEVTAVSIKNSYLGIIEQSKNLFTVFQNHNDKVKSLIGKDFAAGTHERYTTCLKHLKDFVLWKYKVSDFYLKDVDYEFISEFDYYLRSVKNCANNTVVKYIKNFKKIIRQAIAHGWLTKDPFLNYKAKLQKVDRGYLTQIEIDKIKNKIFTIQRMQEVKDAFLFQCYTGLAYADIKKLTPQNIVKSDVNEFWIKSKRTKTGTDINIPLLPEALAIIEHYKDHPVCLNKNVVLPILSNQKYNAYLKELGDLCDISKPLTTHLGRHTFGTTITLANGVSLEVVSKLLSHSSLNTTKIYARMLDGRVGDEMRMLKDKINLSRKNNVVTDAKTII